MFQKVYEVYVVGDCYLHNSIKAAECKNFQTFLKNDDNKTKITDFLLHYTIKQKIEVSNISRCMKIYFSTNNRRQSISYVPYLNYQQEEADTRILRHCQYIVNIRKDTQSLSGHHQAIQTKLLVFHIFTDKETRKIETVSK